MGFVSDTVSAFTGGAARDAGRAQERAAMEAQAQLRGDIQQGIGELRTQSGLSEEALNEALAQQLGFLSGGEQRGLENLFGYGAGAMDLLGRGGQQAQDLVSQYYGQAAEPMRGFAQGGNQAFQTQLALTGALGPQAQQSAYDAFVESPGQQFLQEQGARQVNRAASTSGLLNSGRVLNELQKQGQGLAAQDFGNYFNRLAGTSQQGMQGASALSNLLQRQGTTLADIARGTTGNQAQIMQQLGAGGSDIIMDIARRRAAAAGQTGTNLANLRQSLGSNIANALMQQGTGIAQLLQDQGAAKAAGILGQAEQRLAGLESLGSFGSNSGMFSSLFGGGSAGPAGMTGGADALFAGSTLGPSSAFMFSDKNLKDNVEDLDAKEAFNIVMNMDIKKWKYIAEAKIDRETHFGPMAQNAPDCITDLTKRLINVHDSAMLVAKAMQYAFENPNAIFELKEKVEGA